MTGDISIISNQLSDVNINKSVKQEKGLNRNTIDKYYTKYCVVEQCIKSVQKYITISNND
jgi:hypothetical protein